MYKIILFIKYIMMICLSLFMLVVADVWQSADNVIIISFVVFALLPPFKVLYRQMQYERCPTLFEVSG